MKALVDSSGKVMVGSDGKVATDDCPGTCCAATGACCVGTDCSILSEADCTTALGIYQGDDTTCDPDPCTVPCFDWPWYSSFEATFTWEGTVYVPYVDGVDTLFHAVNITGSTITVSDPGLTGEANGSSDTPEECNDDDFFADCGLGCGEVDDPWSFDVFTVFSSACFTDEQVPPQTWHVGFAGAYLGNFNPAIGVGANPYGTHSGTLDVIYTFNEAGVDDLDFPGRPTLNWSMTVVAP